MTEDVLRFQSLSMSFASKKEPALHSISTSIKYGKITGLVGPDGAGKTTLLRLCAGLLTPTTGEIIYYGNQKTFPRDLIGYMPQKFGLYEDLSVIENLRLYADLKNIDRKQQESDFKTLLKFTDLERFVDRYAGKLSGGMKQKLGLACTLLGSPKLLLLDEPSVGVDPISRRELWKMVSSLVNEGMSVVWSTAYLDEAEHCHDVFLMNEGKVIGSGTPDQFMNEMTGRSVHVKNITTNKRFVLQKSLRDPRVIDGVIQGKNVRLVLKEKNIMPDLLALDAGDNAEIVAVVPRLEDAFMSYLGGGPGGDSVLSKFYKPVVLSNDVPKDRMIEAVQLTKKFGAFTATDHVTFKVPQGEIFGLLGPNGAGKSTTFKMMCGLLIPTEGQALVSGMDLKKSAGKARQRLGYMAQKFSLYNNISVEQNLNFFSGIYGLKGQKKAEKIQQMIDSFDLASYREMNAGELPLGFKQRLALACSIMHEPEILFLDEPTSGVDPITRREFWTHISGLVEKGVTIMVTTHFMDEAEYCDRIALVYKGNIVAAGTPDELKDSIKDKVNDPTMEDAFIYLVENSKL